MLRYRQNFEVYIQGPNSLYNYSKNISSNCEILDNGLGLELQIISKQHLWASFSYSISVEFIL